MDSCLGVEQDLDKATTKFTALNDHAKKVLEDILNQVQELKKEFAQRKYKYFSLTFFVRQ